MSRARSRYISRGIMGRGSGGVAQFEDSGVWGVIWVER